MYADKRPVRELLPFLFVAAGLGACGYAVWKHLLVRRSASWPRVMGEVTRSEIVRTSSGHWQSPNTIFKAIVEYDYEVAGGRYHGDTIDLGGTVNTSIVRHAERRCARYPVGARVTIVYDPEGPEHACLERSSNGPLLLGAIGLVFTVAGLFFL